jgi:putative transposase
MRKSRVNEERMMAILREQEVGARTEFLNEEIFEDLAHARRLFERWRRDYNQVRPHSAHGLTPAGARLLAAGARPGLADGPAARSLAPSPSPCY